MEKLSSLRAEIDQLDEQLWHTIGKRMLSVRQVGEWKKLHGTPVLQPERWEQVIQNCQKTAQNYGLSEQCIREVMEAIHKESIRVES